MGNFQFDTSGIRGATWVGKMRRYKKGDKAKPGFYIDGADLIQVDSTRVIPDTAEGSYIKVQGILATIIMAVLGLGMVLFLPFAALVGLAAYLGKPFRRKKAQAVEK
jgi:hypothetical protein